MTDETPIETDEQRETGIKALVRNVSRRLAAEHPGFEQTRDDMMKQARKSGLNKLDRQEWTYTELDRMYPPILVDDDADAPTGGDDLESGTCGESEGSCAENRENSSGGSREPVTGDGNPSTQPPIPSPPSRTREAGLHGLSDIPEDWPELPDNASLAAEISWVQANRLRVVEEANSNTTLVHLDRARTPAPSWAALSWLETSIRNYAKFLDISVKATAKAQDETDDVREERLQIKEIRDVLAEMLEV